MPAVEKETKSVFRNADGRAAVLKQYEQILTQWPVPHERRYVGKTHIIECGSADAPPLILLHGTMSNSAAWMGDVKEWSTRFRVIAADIPGEPGFSSELRVSPSGDAFPDWFDGLLKDLGYAGTPVSIAGQSLGAFVALKFAVKYPERVKKLSMLTASGITQAKIGIIFRALFLNLFGKRGAARVNRLIAHGVDIGQEAAEFGYMVSKNCNPLLEPIPLFSDEQMRKLTMPVQFFGGEYDVMLNTKTVAARLKELVPSAEINILPDTGHVVIGKTKEILDFMAG